MIGLQSPPLLEPRLGKGIISRAFRVAKITGSTELPSHAELLDGLEILNAVIDQANLDKTLAPYQASLAVPLQAGKVSYLIGPDTASPPPDIISARPVEVLSGYSRRDTVDCPFAITHQSADYDQIRLKSQAIAGWISCVYYQTSYPSGVLYVHPVPNDSVTTAYLTVNAQIGIVPSLNSEVDLPPLYINWLIYKTAKRLCPEYGLVWGTASEEVLFEMTGVLKDNNLKPLAQTKVGLAGLAYASQGGSYNILAG